jgi:glucosylceramidase
MRNATIPLKASRAACILAELMVCAGCAAQHLGHTTPRASQVDKTRPGGPGLEGNDIGAVGEYASRLGALRAENAADPPELDPYGGWANASASLVTPNPNGYFRVMKLDGAWWFVTPDGNPFVSKAVTDVNYLGAILSPGPFHDFMVEKYGTEEAWATAAHGHLLDWGFNTVGPWSSHSMGTRMAHAFIILDFGGSNGPRHPGAVVTDYWDQAFAEHCATMVRDRATPHVEDKNLIGYFLDNEIVWGSDHFLTNKSLIQLYVEFPEGAPGRAEALRYVREAAGSIDNFNSTWKTEITGWDQLEALPAAALEADTDEARAVTEAFMLRAFHQYNTISINALRAVDPNHLILGCRFHTYPGDALVEASVRHFDVISMAFYEPRPPVKEIDAIYGRVDMPFLIEEWTFKSDDSGIVNPRGIYAPTVRTEHERGLVYGNYVETFMRRPYAVGYHWYKWMDNPVLPDRPFSGDNCGILNQNDEPYGLFAEFAGETNRRVESWHAQGGNAVHVVMSSRGGSRSLLVDRPLLWEDTAPEDTPVIEVDLSTRGQSILGLGASLDHATCANLSKLPDDWQSTVLETLVNPQTGIGMNLMRLCIGTSDFIGEPYYTFNDLPAGGTDPDLEQFTIEKDRAYVLPAIKIAQKHNPELLFFGSPWSPPAWMKTSGKLETGSLKREHYPAYAKYLLKFVRAYEAEGVPIHAITVQNEPRMSSRHYPTTQWTADEERDFIRDHLGPLFEENEVETLIWCWDHNWNMPEHPRAILSDPQAARYVDGTAFHHYEGSVEAQSAFRAEFSDKHVYFTEGSVFGPSGAIQLAEILRHGSRSYNAWVILLDEHQKPNRGPHKATPTCIELLDDGSVRPNFDFYMYGQFMKFIKRGAVLVESSLPGIGTFGHVVFMNPDGGVVLVAANAGANTQSFAVRTGGKAFAAELPPESVATYMWRSE